MNEISETKKELLKESLPFKSKLSFGSITAANVIMSQVAFAAITFYYNVKLGVPEEWIALAWIIFAAWNAINDPLFGFIEDRTKSKKYGRRIPYLRFGSPIYGFLFILCWFPFLTQNVLALFINLILILFAFDTIYTITGLITYSLPAEMAISSKTRANLMVYGSIFSSLGFLVAFLLPVVLLTGDNTTEISPAFLITMVIIGISCATVIFIGSFYINENKYTQLEEPLGMLEGLKETFKNKPFLIFEVSNFSFLLAQTILTSAVFYYINFVLGLSGLLSMVPLLIFFLMVFAFTPVYSKMVGKYGLKKMYIVSFLISGVGFILLFFLGWTFFTALIALLFIGIGFSGIFLTSQAVFAECIDFDEVRTEKRRETTYSGVNALITKPAISIANFLFLLVISSFGFQRAAQTQSPSAQLGIMIGFTIIPAIFIIISALVVKFFPLYGPEWEEKKVELKKIHERKEKEYISNLKEEGII
ncbi:MAG: MFS transporter [Candidatus Lokiarchaeota archaeon]|nr:MFS transporter [Candidatus Lokiarchaeota archaeon]